LHTHQKKGKKGFLLFPKGRGSPEDWRRRGGKEARGEIQPKNAKGKGRGKIPTEGGPTLFIHSDSTLKGGLRKRARKVGEEGSIHQKGKKRTSVYSPSSKEGFSTLIERSSGKNQNGARGEKNRNVLGKKKSFPLGCTFHKKWNS